jgi:hypothetical protein
MDLLLVLLAAAVFPVACLGFVLWMSRIEDSIPDAVRLATRTPDPPPVLAIPVRAPAPVGVAIPEQRREPPAVAAAPSAAPVVDPVAPVVTTTPTGT